MYASRRVPKGFRHDDGYLQLIHEADRGEGEVGYLEIRSAVERVDDDQLLVEFPDRREDAQALLKRIVHRGSTVFDTFFMSSIAAASSLMWKFSLREGPMKRGEVTLSHVVHLWRGGFGAVGA